MLASSVVETLAHSLFLLALVIGPLVLFTWIIHWLEAATQRRLSSRFGWNSVLWTGWLGTPVHELSHALMCLVFQHKIEDMALFQPDRANGRLGYVVHSYQRGNWYQEIGNFFIGIAPLLGGTAALLALLMVFFPETGQQSLFGTDPELPFWSRVSQAMSGLFSGLFQPANLLTPKLWLFIYLVICIGSHMGPSADDYRGALKGGVLLAILLVATSLLVSLVGPDTADLNRTFGSLLVPVVAVLLSVVVLCGLATLAVYLLTDSLDLIRRRGRFR